MIVGIRKKPVNIFRPYLKIVYGAFTSIEEYERWRNTLIDAKNSKKVVALNTVIFPNLIFIFLN
ncbi:hypothetical protein [Spiroplasma endosymbiont of Agriotes lineatus]|uniref:hypothetical protein n=1 Tax=Spiroplasma endosymbiont of Agriotes lineatus TaxID=3077930 RepID=UPI0030CD9822